MITSYWILSSESRNFFDRPITNYVKLMIIFLKIAIGQGDDYTAGCLLNYTYFKENYMFIAIHLSKQKGLNVDLKTIRQINFTGNLGQA